MNARPKKSFGQHFLHEKRYIDRIVSSISPKDGDTLVEIGPGEGAMTMPLLAVARRMTAIELDTDLIPGLQQRAAAIGELRIVHSDVLKVDFSALAAELGAERLRIAGNLPYYISSPILFHCVEHAAAIQDMHFMLQKEVVDRMAAEPGSKVYGRLSVMLQLACRVTPLFTVPPGAFRPPPKVDSAVVRLVPLPADQRPAGDPAKIHAVVKAAFAMRRKTLANTLKGMIDEATIRAVGIDPRARAETLAPTDFVKLANVM
ncbi:16S rRNA (adenine(1518)-N(6)/adenine(1519)-N(6))-dimethyltransferase RsmA [Luteibacter sp. SG786]|uniref:16S rRNA (adenine(1518)-N(6)/adenine(1519)-N(6))- dimethyltransferase RsmA n=1 Tax=Luteibacter sp. SG786 TaxID=2587130 RepID=UPI001420237A|nr:16S rRNA (adenine(1518)-N(6)/adenine(1519)-N(6))-dimethyltransferase RsmA [Luteibacter sp. SG786]NII56296.1 16S rRNA (adenine1518-N6/adenine1519-N6)-dimethyltransferase [Luteibacter sp. SG786]